MKKEGSILLTIADGFHYRYLIDTGIMKHIAKSNFLVIVTLPALRQDLESYLQHNDIIARVIDQPKSTSARLRLIWQDLYKKAVFLSSAKLSGTLNIKNELRVVGESKIKTVLNFLLKSRRLNAFIRQILQSSFYDVKVAKLLKDNKVKLIVTSTPAQKDFDIPYLYMAQQMAITSVSPVYSWDNLTAKGPFYFNPSYLIVWNNIMKMEAIEYHSYNDDRVFACGVPVFDKYYNILNEVDIRSNFLISLGLDPDLPLITLTTIPQIYYGNSHLELSNRLLEQRGGALPNFNLLVRPHPMDETDYKQLCDKKNVLVDNYGSKPDKSLKKWKPAKNNIEHLGRTMKYSDVVLNVASTITIDAACFDTPIVNISFDLKRSVDEYMGSISRYYNYTHYKHVTTSSASALAGSFEEMIEYINRYLEDPCIHAQQRKQLVEQQVLSLDGNSYKRIANVINQLAEK